MSEGQDRELIEKMLMEGLKEQRRSRRWGVFFKLLTFAYFAVFIVIAATSAKDAGVKSDEDHVAVVKVSGVIAEDEAASSDKIATGLRDAFEHEKTKAVLLVINSPGGSPVQSGQIYDEINRLKEKHDKKVYAVIKDVGASGAYYIAAAADEIYADKASLVGSIGVISSGFGFPEALDKLGVERRVFNAGANKAMLDPFSKLDEGQVDFWQSVLKVTHKQFIDQVRKGRGEKLKDDEQVFSGLIWTGEQAVDLGLIDGLNSPGGVARDVIGVDNIVDFSFQEPPFASLIKQLGAQVTSSLRLASINQTWLLPSQ